MCLEYLAPAVVTQNMITRSLCNGGHWWSITVNGSCQGSFVPTGTMGFKSHLDWKKNNNDILICCGVISLTWWSRLKSVIGGGSKVLWSRYQQQITLSLWRGYVAFAESPLSAIYAAAEVQRRTEQQCSAVVISKASVTVKSVIMKLMFLYHVCSLPREQLTVR